MKQNMINNAIVGILTDSRVDEKFCISLMLCRGEMFSAAFCFGMYFILCFFVNGLS